MKNLLYITFITLIFSCNNSFKNGKKTPNEKVNINYDTIEIKQENKSIFKSNQKDESKFYVRSEWEKRRNHTDYNLLLELIFEHTGNLKPVIRNEFLLTEDQSSWKSTICYGLDSTNGSPDSLYRSKILLKSSSGSHLNSTELKDKAIILQLYDSDIFGIDCSNKDHKRGHTTIIIGNGD